MKIKMYQNLWAVAKTSRGKSTAFNKWTRKEGRFKFDDLTSK